MTDSDDRPQASRKSSTRGSSVYGLPIDSGAMTPGLINRPWGHYVGGANGALSVLSDPTKATGRRPILPSLWTHLAVAVAAFVILFSFSGRGSWQLAAAFFVLAAVLVYAVLTWGAYVKVKSRNEIASRDDELVLLLDRLYAVEELGLVADGTADSWRDDVYLYNRNKGAVDAATGLSHREGLLTGLTNALAVAGTYSEATTSTSSHGEVPADDAHVGDTGKLF